MTRYFLFVDDSGTKEYARTGEQYGRTGKSRFVDSSRSHLIQVADIVSYNVNRQFVDFPDAWETKSQSVLPTYPWFFRLASKFRTDGSGRIQGYGVVKFPLRTKVRWGIHK